MVFQESYHEIYQDSLVITLSETIKPRLQLFSGCKNSSTFLPAVSKIITWSW